MVPTYSEWCTMISKAITYQSVPDQSVPDQSVPHKGSRKKGSRSNFGTFLVCPEQFSKCPEGDALNVHKSRMYTNQDIHMGVWDHMKCIPTGLPKLKECPPGHIIHPGIVLAGHSVSQGHSVCPHLPSNPLISSSLASLASEHTSMNTWLYPYDYYFPFFCPLFQTS